MGSFRKWIKKAVWGGSRPDSGRSESNTDKSSAQKSNAQKPGNKKSEVQQTKNAANRGKYLKMLAAKTGWDEVDTRERYQEARQRTGARRKNFFCIDSMN